VARGSLKAPAVDEAIGWEEAAVVTAVVTGVGTEVPAVVAGVAVPLTFRAAAPATKRGLMAAGGA